VAFLLDLSTFGALAILKVRQFKALPVALVFPSLVVVYLAYWIGSSLFGPRYFYEGLYSLTVFSASGIAWLADGRFDLGTPGPISRAGGASARCW